MELYKHDILLILDCNMTHKHRSKTSTSNKYRIHNWTFLFFASMALDNKAPSIFSFLMLLLLLLTYFKCHTPLLMCFLLRLDLILWNVFFVNLSQQNGRKQKKTKYIANMYTIQHKKSVICKYVVYMEWPTYNKKRKWFSFYIQPMVTIKKI